MHLAQIRAPSPAARRSTSQTADRAPSSPSPAESSSSVAAGSARPLSSVVAYSPSVYAITSAIASGVSLFSRSRCAAVIDGSVIIHGSGEKFAIVLDRRIQIRRHQHHAIHRHAQLRLQIVRDPRPAKSAIALAHQVLPRVQPVVLHQPVVDHARKILNVRRRASRTASSPRSSGTVARLNPVPIGSMNTRSVKSSHVPGLSVSTAGRTGCRPRCPPADASARSRQSSDTRSTRPARH